jgi:hypothetical protein
VAAWLSAAFAYHPSLLRVTGTGSGLALASGELPSSECSDSDGNNRKLRASLSHHLGCSSGLKFVELQPPSCHAPSGNRIPRTDRREQRPERKRRGELASELESRLREGECAVLATRRAPFQKPAWDSLRLFPVAGITEASTKCTGRIIGSRMHLQIGNLSAGLAFWTDFCAGPADAGAHLDGPDAGSGERRVG